MIGTTIQNSQLPGGLLTTNQIADGAVTVEKLSDEVRAMLSVPVDFDNFKIVAAREAFPLNPQVGYYLLARTDGRAIAKISAEMLPYVIPNFNANKFYNIPHYNGVITYPKSVNQGRILYEFDTNDPHESKRNQVLRYLYYWDGTSWIDQSDLLPRIRKAVYLTSDNLFFDKHRSDVAPFAYFKRIYHFKEIDFNDVVRDPGKYIIYEINYVSARLTTGEKRGYELRRTFIRKQRIVSDLGSIVSNKRRLSRKNKFGFKETKIKFVIYKKGKPIDSRRWPLHYNSKIYKPLNVDLFFRRDRAWNGKYI